jgi:polysaccharide export outer membrane protein
MPCGRSLIKFYHYRFGEVNRPGPYQFIDQNVNLLDVLGKAGDCNPYGDKKSIMVIRKDGDKTITAMVNIHDSGFISNPYFWLKPNDVVYIKPLKAKMLQVNAPFWNIVLSSISTIIPICYYCVFKILK